ncbi:MAG TPA: metal-dependent phosphohydrolase [Gammaproteobacteria bacterium]|nr:metal-dependent phosphohydrolase [Gammaproteobacteria bacterium]
METTVAIPVEELKIGMYVCDLDRPWLETSFLTQGFRISSVDQIKQLKDLCEYVYIDSEYVIGETDREKLRNISSNQKNVEKDKTNIHKRNWGDSPRIDYKNRHSIQDELPKAKYLHHWLSNSLKGAIDTLKSGGSINVKLLKEAVNPLIDSVIRNPDAAMWLARMRKADQYSYEHAVSVSIWITAFGRYLGLPKEDLRELALGGLLFDIGKARIPKCVLEQPRKLIDKEFDLVKRHVVWSVKILESTAGISPRVLEIAAHHHERHDGSGYPQHLKGTEIPLFARMAAIVDCYDAITSKRTYARSLSPHEAIRKLYEWRDKDFQAELVEEFIQAIGLYPAGSLVELNTGEVAVVIAQSRSRRLKPQVMLILDAQKQPLEEFRTLDLFDESAKHLEISRSLEPGCYGINPDELYI